MIENRLRLIASELSSFIFENDDLSQYKLEQKAKEYLKSNFDILPCHIDYVIDMAYDIYYKI